tara:strand:+ start:786 stop:911 length:126 start_codon:yes stop_codon:yes gene_type:complete
MLDYIKYNWEKLVLDTISMVMLMVWIVGVFLGCWAIVDITK